MLEKDCNMKKITFAVALSMAALASPAFAEPSCTPGASLKPMWESVKLFEDAGGKVIAVKINDGGCYEVYGTVGEKKFEVFFDPNTGAELERIEA
jgi:hypothetical protein